MLSSQNSLPALKPSEMSPPAAHVEFLGLPFCTLPQHEVVRMIIERPGAPFRYVVTPNAYHVVAVHNEPARLLPVYQRAWLSLCDSRILAALARLEGRSLPLATGSDLVAALLSALNANPRPELLRRLLVVGPPHVAQALLRNTYPHLMLDVMPAPANLAEDAEARLAVARACMARPWDILLLCVGCPAQELIAQQLAELGCKAGIALCVGAAIDFLIGVRVRAPLPIQKLGLEWAYRLAREPRRLWRRYLVESPKVFRIFMATRSARTPRG